MEETSQKFTPFRWDRAKEIAAELVARGDETDEEIARKADVSRRALFLWRKRPEFAARVAEHQEAFRQVVLNSGIARLENRVNQLDDRWKRMRKVIDERAETMQNETAGGGTGLIVRDYKSIGTGEYAREVEIYRVDTGLLRELREHEKQAAQELGQWTENKNVTGTAEVVLTYAIVPPNEEVPVPDQEPGPLGEGEEEV